MLFTLADKRIDKETENWLLWELPLSRALRYHHCALRAAGQWTVPLDEPISVKLGNQELFAAMHDDEEDLVIEEDFD